MENYLADSLGYDEIDAAGGNLTSIDVDGGLVVQVRYAEVVGTDDERDQRWQVLGGQRPRQRQLTRRIVDVELGLVVSLDDLVAHGAVQWQRVVVHGLHPEARTEPAQIRRQTGLVP